MVKIYVKPVTTIYKFYHINVVSELFSGVLNLELFTKIVPDDPAMNALVEARLVIG